MKTIYKYKLSLESDIVFINMPMDAFVIHVDIQHGDVYLWAMVDTDAAMERRIFRVIGTGHPAEDVGLTQHIGSFLVLNGTYVFHIFDVGVVPTPKG